MGKILVIVESPTKIKTLKKFLGGKFFFEASLGHIRDLPKKDFGIDVEHGFEPKYVNLPEKKEVIQKLKKAAKQADKVYLSPDPDREGEAIAWHIFSILPKDVPIQRVTFNSITKNAVLEALQHPREIDLSLVNAQQARRLLDRIVGYKISPILTRKIRRGKMGTSAGRVQSVALKLVVDREKEIDAFVPSEYWNLDANLKVKPAESGFEASLFSIDGKKVEKEQKGEENVVISSEGQAKDLEKILKNASYRVSSVERKEKKRNPVPPFITSTLQQEASRHYGFSVLRTMKIAQELYEGVDLGEEGAEGLITYMRTDSVQVAAEGISSARKYIETEYGKEYLPETPRVYASKKSAQEAHEAIRPTNLYHPPETIKKYLTVDQYKIYSLIWKRFLSSQMNPAIYDTIRADILADQKFVFRATGSILKFSGFLILYEEKKDKGEETEEEKPLPFLEEGLPLILDQLQAVQSFTKPPPRFTEASLVKELEKSGIGRPSTYATIMSKIESREYTVKEQNTLRPTELGKIIAQMLEENFKPIMNVGFTSAMEDDLELVAEDKKDWKKLIAEFWEAFIPMVEKAEKDAVVPKEMTDIICPKCGKFLQKIWAKNRYFYGCSGYPECDFTTSIEALHFKKEDYDESFDWEQKCPKCGSPMILRHGRYGPFLGCSQYPKCQGIVNIPKKGEKLAEEIACPAIGCDGRMLMRRSRFGKTFYSCSNFPDCDVIVNDPADLEKKYDATHPKTAYVKKVKEKGKKGKEKTVRKPRETLQYTLSKDLSSLLGEKKLSRGEVLKKLWAYIKEHDLQDPKNKRNILPDEKLAKIFGTKEPVDMMKLAGILKGHLSRET